VIRQSARIFLIIVLFGYPALSCLVPEMQMTEAERECCRQMAQQCGSMNMPASHSCCQKQLRQPGSMLRVTTVQVAPLMIAVPIVAKAADLRLEIRQIPSFRFHPPPESPPGISSILRI